MLNILLYYHGDGKQLTVMPWDGEKLNGNEKTLGETQKLRAGRSNVEPKIFALPQTPFPRTSKI